MTALEIRPLVHFLAVLDERSLGRAARRMNLSQPALSKSIRQLELTLGVPLFERGADGMRPTSYSTVLAERARLIVQEAVHAREEIDELCGRWRGTVTVCAGPSIVGPLLARAVAGLQARRPGVRVTVMEGLLESHLPALLKGSADFVIGTAGDPTPEGLVAETLFHDTVVVVARASHSLAGREGLSLESLADHPFVLTRTPEILRQALESRFAVAGMPFPDRIVESNSVQFMKALALGGDHLAYLPRLAIATEEKAGLLVPLVVPEATWHREVHLLRRTRGTLSPAARALLHELKQACAAREEGVLELA